MSQFTVVGLGRFGSAVCLELMRLGHSVIGVDSDSKLVDALADQLSLAVFADATNENALRDLNIIASDTVLVAIGDDLEASLLCVLQLKNIGVKEIWVKATSKPHHTILSRIGVSRIIHPEEEMGIRVAQILNYPMVSQYMPIGNNLYIVEIKVGENCEQMTLATLLGKAADNITPVLLRRDTTIINALDDDFILQSGDSLILSGSLETLKTLAPRLA